MKSEDRQGKRHFVFEWRIALFTALLLPLMISLGFWQLRRADENRALISAADVRHQQPAIAIENVLAGVTVQGENITAWQYQPVSVQGQWLAESFLLENQMQAGRNGYYVIAPIQVVDGRRLLVNRGWVAAPALRSQLPDIKPVETGRVEIAEVYMAQNILVDKPVFAESGWPKRIGKLNIPGIEKELGQNIQPIMLRLRPESPSALTVDWPVVNIMPEKNTGYAIQWFGMSLALAVSYILLSFRRERPAVKNIS
jgi:surfeit locus 1 family protein